MRPTECFVNQRELDRYDLVLLAGPPPSSLHCLVIIARQVACNRRAASSPPSPTSADPLPPRLSLPFISRPARLFLHQFHTRCIMDGCTCITWYMYSGSPTPYANSGRAQSGLWLHRRLEGKKRGGNDGSNYMYGFIMDFLKMRNIDLHSFEKGTLNGPETTPKPKRSQP